MKFDEFCNEVTAWFWLLAIVGGIGYLGYAYTMRNQAALVNRAICAVSTNPNTPECKTVKQ
jgi:hypothetical protein